MSKMNNYELHETATRMTDSYTPYTLARDLLQAQDHIEELEAQIEYLVNFNEQLISEGG